MRGGEWNEPSVTAEHQHVNMLTLAFSLYFYTCRPFILSTVYSPCVDFLFCFKWSNVNHVKGAVTVLLHASQTKCHLDNSEAYAGSHCAEFICILNCCFLCFWMCFSHSLELSFLFSFLQNEKPLGHSASRSSNISKVSKAHTNGKISMSDVWLSSTTERERRQRAQKTRGQRWDELWRSPEIDRTDIHTADGWHASLASQRSNKCWSLNRHVSTPQLPGSACLSVRLVIETFFSVSLSTLSPPPPSIAPSGKACMTPGFQSLFSWASNRINPLPVLINVMVTS